MYYQAQQCDAYRRSAIETSTPESLILMLYEGAVSSLAAAEKAMSGEGQDESARTSVYKAQDIIGELMSSLDFEQGGEIAANLFRLYEYFNYRLIQANVNGDANLVAEVRSSLAGLRDAWRDAMASVRAGGAAAQVAAL